MLTIKADFDVYSKILTFYANAENSFVLEKIDKDNIVKSAIYVTGQTVEEVIYKLCHKISNQLISINGKEIKIERVETLDDLVNLFNK